MPAQGCCRFNILIRRESMFVSGKKILYGMALVLAVLAFAGCPNLTEDLDPTLSGVVGFSSGGGANPQAGVPLAVDITGLEGSGTLTYQWERGDSADGEFAVITGANNASYTPHATNDLGKYIRVTVSRAGYKGTKTAVTAAAVAAAPITWTAAANGSSGSETSTAITFTFSEAVTELAASNITVTGSVTVGELSGEGTTRTLALSAVSAAGNVSITITKGGIASGPQDVAVYKENETADFSWTAAANGAADTETSTSIVFTFSGAVTGLTANDISITGGTGSVTKGAVSGNGQSWTLALSAVATAGDVSIAISKAGIVSAAQAVTVYKAASDPDTVATPVADPTGRTFTDSIDVTLTSATAGAEIYYTLTTNLEPEQAETTDNFKYTTAITITDTVILRAKAFKAGLTPSGVVTQNYTKETPNLGTVATPTVSPEPPLTFYDETLEITLATTTEGAAIRYTLDGSAPNANSQLYTAPFAIGTGVDVDTEITVKAIGIKEFMINSEVLTVKYTKGDPSKLYTKEAVFSPAAGAIDSGGTVTLTSEDGGAIYYTLDGTTPTAETGTAYTVPIAITENTLIKAIAVKAGWNPSEVVEAKYLARINAGGMTWLDITGEIPNFGINNRAFFAKSGTRYVVVQGGRSWHSTDRLHWTEGGAVFSSGILSGLAAGNGRLVAIGSGGRAYSLDEGETWTVQVGPFNNIVWGGPTGEEVFVAGGIDGSIFWSSDGINWTKREAGVDADPWPPGDSGLSAGSYVTQIIWEGGKFVAVAFYRDMAYSVDGKTWTNAALEYAETEDFRNIIYTGTEYLVSSRIGGTKYNLYTFTNNLSNPTVISDMGYEVQVYNNGTIFSSSAYSTDKTTWTPFVLPHQTYIYKIDGKIVSIGSSGICIQE
jgi:hypothetical protein